MAQLSSQLEAVAGWQVSYALDAFHNLVLTHRQTFRAGLEREELACHYPGNGTPRTSKEEDVDAHKSDSRPLRWEIRGAGYGTCDSHNVLADAHADGSQQKQIATAQPFDHVETWKCGRYVD